MNSDGLTPHVEPVQPRFELLGAPPELARPRSEVVVNYASDARVVERIKREIIPAVGSIRDSRQTLNDLWNSLHKVWTLQHDENKSYTGVSDIYMPAGKRGTETIVTQLVSATMPGDDNFGVEAYNPARAQQANELKEVLKYRIDSTAKVRVMLERYYRQLAITGNSPIKIYYQRKVINALGRGMNGGPTPRPHVVFDSPVVQSVDVNNFYVWPETVNDPQDAQIIFEDITTDYAGLLAKARAGVYDKAAVLAAGRSSLDSSKTNTDNMRLSSQGLSSPHNMTADGWRRVDVTEVWLDFDPMAASREEEENPEPFLVTITSTGEVLRAIPNPFWHKRPPYLLGRMGTTVGRVYGTGFVESIRELNRLLNDQTNQAMDCATYVLNPIVLTNPNLTAGPLASLEPGVQWLVHDVNAAVRFERPPVEMIQAGSILTTGTQSWIADFIGAPPVLSGGSSPGRAFRTATGVGAAQTNAKMPLQEIVRLNEAEVWEPMLHMIWSLDQQFASGDIFVPIIGKDMLRVDVNALSGDWLFRWLASSQTSNQAIKGSQIAEALRILSDPRIIDLFKQQGIQVNPEPLVRRMYLEVFGFRDVDEVLVRGTLGLPPGGPAVPDVRTGRQPSSGAPTVPDLPPELQDNEPFQEVRGEADAIAALMGGAVPIT